MKPHALPPEKRKCAKPDSSKRRNQRLHLAILLGSNAPPATLPRSRSFVIQPLSWLPIAHSQVRRGMLGRCARNPSNSRSEHTASWLLNTYPPCILPKYLVCCRPTVSLIARPAPWRWTRFGDRPPECLPLSAIHDTPLLSCSADGNLTSGGAGGRAFRRSSVPGETCSLGFG